MQIIDKIISNFTNNKSLYIGEKITTSEHMIQTAMIAEKAKCNDDLICSCLLHDYGHFILENPDELVKENLDRFDIDTYGRWLLFEIAKIKSTLDKEQNVRWQKILSKQGWFAVNWPSEYSGCPELSLTQKYILQNLLSGH